MKEFTRQEKNILTQIGTNGYRNNKFLLEVIKVATDCLIFNHKKNETTTI